MRRRRVISSDEATETVVRGIKAGATDYLVKPSSLATFRNIWQHAYRKELASKKKGRRNEDADGEKLRLKWTHDLHQKFSYAVNILGLDKAVPKKILELMNIPNLTKEHVASHLQKFRKFLKTKGGRQSTKMTPEMLAAVSARISSDMELGGCSGAQNGPVMPGHPFNQQPPYILTGHPPSTFLVANPLQPWAHFQPPNNPALNQPASNYTVHNPVVMSQAENTPMPILRGGSGLGEGTLTGQGQASNLDLACQHAHNATDGVGSDIGFCNDEDMGDFLSSLLNSPKEDQGPGHKEDQGQGPREEQGPGIADLEE
ncbi:uncharacterized protein A4U43_C03F15770 [Asparagus officinalis]|uniref:Response regulatory domain-containing protein n=1 Tax=Asparagus officinalis TaxID=4686 RepID=A0A5P1FAE1_ASPOF|nr:uncharacterized protein A4U43_C03F15770 [Asparagus officinalis]